MEIEMLALRLIHFFAGVYWMGVGLFSVLFFTPTIHQTGPEGQTVLRHLVGKTHFSMSMNTAALLATLSGGALFWIDSSQFNTTWLYSSQGSMLAAGSLFGISAFLVSSFMQSRSARKIGQIGKTVAANGKFPTPEQMTQLRAYQQRLIRGAQVTAVLLTVTLISMATWRYAY